MHVRKSPGIFSLYYPIELIQTIFKKFAFRAQQFTTMYLEFLSLQLIEN